MKKDKKRKTLCVPKLKKKNHCFKGKELIPYEYFNINLCGKRNSGKTVLIYNIVKWFVSSHTKTYIISPTIQKDNNMKKVVKLAKKQGADVKAYSGFKAGNKDVIKHLMKKWDNEDKKYKTYKSQKHNKTKPDPKIYEQQIREYFKGTCIFAPSFEEIEDGGKTKPPIKYDRLLIIDDNSEELRHDKSFKELIFMARHYRCRIVYSSHDLKHSSPAMFQNLTHAVLYGKFSDDRLKCAHERLDPVEDLSLFSKLYKHCTKQEYGFMIYDLTEYDKDKQYRNGLFYYLRAKKKKS